MYHLFIIKKNKLFKIAQNEIFRNIVAGKNWCLKYWLWTRTWGDILGGFFETGKRLTRNMLDQLEEIVLFQINPTAIEHKSNG